MDVLRMQTIESWDCIAYRVREDSLICILSLCESPPWLDGSFYSKSRSIAIQSTRQSDQHFTYCKAIPSSIRSNSDFSASLLYQWITFLDKWMNGGTNEWMLQALQNNMCTERLCTNVLTIIHKIRQSGHNPRSRDALSDWRFIPIFRISMPANSICVQ